MNFQVSPSRASSPQPSGKSCLAAGVLLVAGMSLVGSVQTSKAAATPTPAPTASPTAAPTATPEEAPEIRSYDGTQQENYIKTANSAFLEVRGAKSTAFVEANNVYLQAGGASGTGLTLKEAIAARREMIQKALQANDDYLAFIDIQEKTYHDELAKTPLIKADVDGLTANFAEHAKTADVKKLRETERDLLKTGDSMMGFLEKNYGAWKLSGNKPVFKKAADANAYSALGKKYNADVETVQKLSAAVSAPLPTPGASPSPGGAASPAGTALPQATVSAAATSPAPAAKAKP